jgi:hypothetical protein
MTDVPYLQQLPGDIVSHIAFNLPLRDAASFCITSRHLCNMLKSNHHLWISLVDNLLKFHVFREVSVVSYLHDVYENIQDRDLLYAFLKLLLGRIPPYPSSIDMKTFDWHRGPSNVTPLDMSKDASSNIAVAFTGLLGESTRSIVANNCFPYLPFDYSDQQYSLVPFCRVGTVHMDLKSPNPIGVVSLAFAAYYECRILERLNTAGVTSSQPYDFVSQRNIVRVGLACPPFPLKGLLPGSDNFSFGYDSLDGCLYREGEARSFGGESFGPGDVVGCGILYGGADCSSKGKIFFTKNGAIQGVMLDIASPTFLNLSWFPTVGFDTHHPVSLNFGKAPFVFDLYRFEKKSFGYEGGESYVPIQSQLHMAADQDIMPRDIIRRPFTPPVDTKKKLEGAPPLFGSKALLHRTLRIIDPDVYRFQVTFL